MALVLAKHTHEPFVIFWRHVEHGNQHLVIRHACVQGRAERSHEGRCASNPVDERLIDRRPEGLALLEQPLEQAFGRRVRLVMRLGRRSRAPFLPDFDRELVRTNPIVVLPKHQSLHNVLELADVAGPR